MLDISIPSRTIFPSSDDSSSILSIPKVNVDLPDPVRPIIPIFYYGEISNEIPLITFSNSSLYLSEMFLIVNLPSLGQFLGGSGS